MQAIAGSSFVPRLTSLALKPILTNPNVHLPPEFMRLDIPDLGPDEMAQNLVMNNMPWPEKLAGLLTEFTCPFEGTWPKTIEELDVQKHLPSPDDFRQFTDLLALAERLGWQNDSGYTPHDPAADYVSLPPIPEASAREALGFLASVRAKLNEKLISANESGLNAQPYALVRPTLNNCKIAFKWTEDELDRAKSMSVDLRDYVLKGVHLHDLPYGKFDLKFDGADLADCKFYGRNLSNIKAALSSMASLSNCSFEYEIDPMYLLW